MPDPQGNPTPQELLLQKLKAVLQFGKNGNPNQGKPSGVEGNVPVNPDDSYPREDSGLLKRGATIAQQGQPQPTDATGQPKPGAPTITPVTAQGSPQQPATGGKPGPTQPTPQLPAFVPPAPPTPFTPPSKLSRLGHTLAYGVLQGVDPAIQYNQNIGTEERKSAQDVKNYPQTLAAAKIKYAQDQAELANKNASTANLNREAQGTPTDPRKQLEADYIKQRAANDPQAATTLDMLARLYPKDFKAEDEAEMAKIPPQILAQTGPKPVTPDFAMPGKPVQHFNSTAEAQAAWGLAVSESSAAAQAKANAPEKLELKQLQDAQGKRFTGRVDASGNMFTTENGPDGKPVPAPKGSQLYEQPTFGDVYTPTRGAEAMEKPTSAYSDFLAQTGAAKENIGNARDGSQLANAIAPLQTALIVTGAGGVHRINMNEINRSGDPNMGSLARQIDAQLEKAGTGKLPAETVNEMSQLVDLYAKYKYKTYLQNANANSVYFKMGDVPVMAEDGNSFLPLSEAMRAAGIMQPATPAKPGAAAPKPGTGNEGKKAAKWNGKEWNDATTGKPIAAAGH